jgi:hypothetical protein
LAAPSAITLTFTKIAPSACDGTSNNGSVTAVATGGTPTYTYNWGGGNTLATLSNLGFGTYPVTVTDANGCSTTGSVTLAPLSTTTLSIPQNATKTRITAVPTGGTPPYSYNWYPHNGNPPQILINNGTMYSLTVTDANGCTAVFSNFPTLVATATLVAPIACVGGTTMVNVSGTGGAAPLTGGGTFSVGAGTYSYTITDASGTTAATSITVTAPMAVTISATSGTILCNGGTTNVTLTTGGGTGTITTSPSATGLGVGTYTFTATDANGCTKSTSITITQPTPVTISATAGVITCNGGTTNVTLTTGGGTGAITTSPSTTGLSAGTYTFTATDANGCTKSTSITITQPTPVTISATAGVITCNGGTTNVTLTTGGGTGAITTSPSATGLGAGTYTFTATDANGCTASTSITITEPTVVTISATSGAILCNGGTTNVTLTTGGGTGAITTSPSTTGLGAGTYTFTATDANGCTASTGITITEPSALSINLVKTDPSCNPANGVANGTIDATVTGGTGSITYAWSNSATTEDLTMLGFGSYTLNVTDANGCMASDITELVAPPAMTISKILTAISCNVDNGVNNDAAINITVSNGTGTITYDWGGGIVTEDRMMLGEGTYTVTATDANGCTVSEQTILTEPAAMDATFATTDLTCNGGMNGAIMTTVTNGTSPFTYNWLGGQTTADLTGLSSGAYYVTITDDKGCEASSETALAQPSAIVITFTTTTVGVTNCDGTSNNAVLTASATGGTGAISFDWGGGNLTNTLSGLGFGTYTVTATDGNGCTVSASQTVQGVFLTTTAIPNFLNANKTKITANPIGGTPPYTLNWSTNSGNPPLIVINSGTSYSVTVTDANGCTFVLSGVAPKVAQITDPKLHEDEIHQTTAPSIPSVVNDLVLRPNPTADITYLDFAQPITTKLDVYILDIAGKQIEKRLFEKGSERRLSFESYASGVYLIKVISEDGQVFVKRLVLQQ